MLGSAVLQGQATEIIDIAHFLPLAFDDWFPAGDEAVAAAATVLLVDDSAFFRDMLTPVLKAAGYRVRTAPSARGGLWPLLRSADRSTWSSPTSRCRA